MTLRDPDAFYAGLMARQAGLDEAQSLRFCARLILLLANEVGEDERLQALLDQASNARRGDLPPVER